MLAIHDAWARLLPYLTPKESSTATLDAASGRILSDDLLATLDVPPCDVSAMDGFALSAQHVEGQTQEARNVSIGPTIAAGDAPGATLAEISSGQVAAIPRIMTGAPAPSDCDRVVPVELATISDDGRSVRFAPANLGTAGQHIRRAGEVSRTGEALLQRGQPIRAATACLLATHGHIEVPVWRNPRVAFTTTGSEIVPPSQQPKPGQIRDSHSAFFTAALSELGIAGENLGIARDDRKALLDVLRQGLEYEVFLISGGVSMGEFDLVEDVLAKLNCNLLFDAVAIQPGKPMVAAVHSGGLVFGLPGNPASAQITYRLFVEPALRQLRGESAAPWSGALSATLTTPLPGARGRDRFLPCQLERRTNETGQTELLATPRPPQGSHDVLAYGVVNGIVRIEHDQPPRQAGDRCSVLFAT